MNGLEAMVSDGLSVAEHCLCLAIAAALGAAPLAGIVLLVNLLGRRWLTATQMSLLWGLVLVRLAMPFAPASVLSVQNLFAPEKSSPTPLAAIVRSPTAVDAWPDPRHARAVSLPATSAVTAATVSGAGWVRLLLVVTWMVGGAFLLARTAAVHWRFARRVNRLLPCRDDRLTSLWQSCCGEAGVRRPIAVVHFDELAQPAVMGLFRPKLLLPTRLAELGDDQLRMIMLHELAHVRRHDVLLNWILLAIRAIHWPNPVYWLAAARFGNLREQACDAFVMRRGAGQATRAYSELLLVLAGQERIGSPWRVTLPASILGLWPAYFRNRAIRDRLGALPSAGWAPSRGQVAAVFGLIMLTAVCGLTDAKPPAEPIDSRAPSGELSAKSLRVAAGTETDHGPFVKRTYDLEAAIARIEATSSTTSSAVLAIKFQIDNVLRSGPHWPKTSRPAMYILDGTRLIVTAPADLHDELIESIEAWEDSGLGQIAVQCRFVTSEHEIAPRAEISWRYLGAFAEDSPQSLPSQRPTDRPLVRAQTSVGLPVAFATLDENQAAAVLQAVSTDARTSILRAPNVTMFNGQRASIVDVTVQPFIVGIRHDQADGGEAEVREFENGTKITLRPIHTSDQRQVHVQGRIELNHVDQGYVAPTGSGPEAASLQFPRSKQCRIDFACQVEDGQSVLIGCLPANDEKQFFYALLTVQTVAHSADGRD